MIYLVASFRVQNRPRQYQPLYEFVHARSGGRARIIEDGAVILGGFAHFTIALAIDDVDTADKMEAAFASTLGGELGTLEGIDMIKTVKVPESKLETDGNWEADLCIRTNGDPRHFSTLADKFKDHSIVAQRMHGSLRGWKHDVTSEYEAVYSLVPTSPRVDRFDFSSLVRDLQVVGVEVTALNIRPRVNRLLGPPNREPPIPLT